MVHIKDKSTKKILQLYVWLLYSGILGSPVVAAGAV